MELRPGLGSFHGQLEELTRRGMAEHRVPGVAVAITHGSERHIATFGVTSVDHPLDVDAETLFQIGSTTKTLTATALMRLVEAGTLSLDTRVRDHIPELRLADASVAERVTLRHLLTHTGGWESDMFNDFGPGQDALAKAVARMADLPQLTPLGTIWNYSNSGYMLAGRILEVVTGRSYEDAVRELVLDPLAMTHSTFFATEAITHSAAVGHAVLDGRPVVARPWALPRSFNPAGGLVSSVADQLRYAEFHLGRVASGNLRLLTTDTLANMQSPLVRATGGRAVSCGLSWLLQRTPGLIAHGGATNGQRSSFVMVPSRDFAMTVLTNSDTGGLVHRAIVKWAIRDIAGLRSEAPKLVPVPRAGLSEYAGQYVTREQRITVEAKSDKLEIAVERSIERSQAFAGQRTARMTGVVFNGDTLKLLDGTDSGTFAEFGRDDQGTITWLTIFGRIHMRETHVGEDRSAQGSG